MADNFKALIQAELNLDRIESQLEELNKRKIQLQIEVSQNPAKVLQEAISRGLKNTKLSIPDMSKQLADAFNITDTRTLSKIKLQLSMIL